ncbi:dipeptidase [Metabacillus fastidiosus]|uniref:dipeptidase n=1 Tax=Metabacillus fastidiosus TaxID=1458 RepID=UPI000826470D|nr:dipeptidase [Metabacillus fastidiosus]MED4463086.1 dipeptidase [Metabacillus fastidiosus]
MVIFDAHCDLLYKLWRNPEIDVNTSNILQASLQQIRDSGGKIQCFAVFVPEDVPFTKRFDAALEQISLFYKKVLAENKDIKLVKTKSEINELHSNEIGAVLTLEGCDAISDDLHKLHIFYELGVRSVGLTWNYANLVADGAHERRNGGLTNFGRKLIHRLNEKKLWTDLSHASERSFWEAIEIADYPIASHSNVYKLCPHVRNLKDEQITALIKKNGMIGITFVPFFTASSKHPQIFDLLQHIDYVLSLGGENHLGLGSDFDGIDETIIGLENYRSYVDLIDALQKRYVEEIVEKIIYKNFVQHISF